MEVAVCLMRRAEKGLTSPKGDHGGSPVAGEGSGQTEQEEKCQDCLDSRRPVVPEVSMVTEVPPAPPPNLRHHQQTCQKTLVLEGTFIFYIVCICECLSFSFRLYPSMFI